MAKAGVLTVVLLMAWVAIGSSRADAGVHPPNSHELTFENNTTFPADGLFVELSEYSWQVEVAEQPERCPKPGVSGFIGLSANVAWGATCVRVGESVTLLLYGECDDCPPPDAILAWSHDSLGDANCSSSTDAIDALLVLQLVADLVNDIACPTNADVDGDSLSTAVDAVIILQLTAGLIAA